MYRHRRKRNLTADVEAGGPGGRRTVTIDEEMLEAADEADEEAESGLKTAEDRR